MTANPRRGVIRPEDTWTQTLPGDTCWLAHRLGQLREYGTYAANWNGYGEHPITTAALQTGAAVLRRCRTAPSAVVPLATGGIQIEWGPKGDRILEINPEGDIEMGLSATIETP